MVPKPYLWTIFAVFDQRFDWRRSLVLWRNVFEVENDLAKPHGWYCVLLLISVFSPDTGLTLTLPAKLWLTLIRVFFRRRWRQNLRPYFLTLGSSGHVRWGPLSHSQRIHAEASQEVRRGMSKVSKRSRERIEADLPFSRGLATVSISFLFAVL